MPTFSYVEQLIWALIGTQVAFHHELSASVYRRTRRMYQGGDLFIETYFLELVDASSSSSPHLMLQVSQGLTLYCGRTLQNEDGEAGTEFDR